MSGDGVIASILVPMLNEERHTEASVREMVCQEGLDGEIEILVVDGRSTDRTREIVARLAADDDRVRLLDNPARRTPNGLNVALREATGEFIVRMDAHTYYPRDYVARGIERLRRGDEALVCGPVLAVGAGRWSRRVALARRSWLAMGGLMAIGRDDEREIENPYWGVCRRSLLMELGGWDEGWPTNQDGELAARIRARGGRIVALGSMAARYVPRDSLVALARQYIRYGLYREKTCVRHTNGMRLTHLGPPATVIAAAVAILPLPRAARHAARGVLGVHVALLGLASAHLAWQEGAAIRDAAALPMVFATMHLSWGAGFLWGCARFGVPVRALGSLGGRLARRGVTW